MKDDDGIIEPQTWNVEIVNPEDITNISATMLYLPQTDSSFLADLISPVLEGEVDSTNWEEFLTNAILQVLASSFLPVSGTITISEWSEGHFSGGFNALLGEIGCPPQILYIDKGMFEFTDPINMQAPDPPSNVSAELIDDYIELNWTFPDTIIISHFNIYYSQNGIPFETIAQVDFTANSWTHHPDEGGVHAYYLTAVSGILESDPSATVEVEICSNGDVNDDLEVNVLDVVSLVNCILENECGYCSDVNEDGSVNVQDIIVIVNIILG